MLFTVDIDWAAEAVIADTIELFSTYGAHCTLFSTHKSNELLGIDRSLFEIGIHPNFNALLQGKGGDPDLIIDTLKSIHPEAVGVRSHSLTQNGWLLNKFLEKGFEYEVNHFLPYHHGIKPFLYYNGMVRIPFNWEDDYHFAHGFSFNDSLINLADEGLSIFNFHPIHIYLNTEHNARYESVKHRLHDVRFLQSYRNESKVPGTRDILISLLGHARDVKSPTRKLREVAREAREKAGIMELKLVR